MANKTLSQIYVNSCQFFKKPAVQKEYQKLLTEFQEKEKVKTEINSIYGVPENYREYDIND